MNHDTIQNQAAVFADACLGINETSNRQTDRDGAMAELALHRIADMAEATTTYSDLSIWFRHNGATQQDLEIALKILRPVIEYDCDQGLLAVGLEPLGHEVVEYLKEVREE